MTPTFLKIWRLLFLHKKWASFLKNRWTHIITIKALYIFLRVHRSEFSAVYQYLCVKL